MKTHLRLKRSQRKNVSLWRNILTMAFLFLGVVTLQAQVVINEIYADNGKEFAEHQRIAEELGIDFYFAKPYHSWERGANENLNGLVRQYFPKGSDFSNIDHDYLNKIEEKLNRRPRKRYQFDSPQQVMAHKINQTSILHFYLPQSHL